ncbi:myelin regulatory factor-like protein [Engraulis encrasicolus]|uniref:myelin regulatory factor-like protein n=1 Tax=Engraulis encrasicolus TaxID=184585 RepID=UPI002FCEE5EA
MVRGGLMDVLGETEALQQFFDGQDVIDVVDTSMLEQYLGIDMEPSNFMLPESPPDSGSEPCSPPQMNDVHSATNGWSDGHQLCQESLHPATARPPAVSCRLKERPEAPYGAPQNHHHHSQHNQPHHNPHNQGQPQPHAQPHPHPHHLHPHLNTHLQGSSTHPHHASPARESSPIHHPQYRSPAVADGYIHTQTPPLVARTSPLGHEAIELPQCMGPQVGYPSRTNGPHAPPSTSALTSASVSVSASASPSCLVQSPVQGGPETDYPFLQHSSSSGHQLGSALNDSKKRRRSESFEAAADNRPWGVSVWTKAPHMGGAEGASCEVPAYDSDAAGGQGAYQLLSWDQHQPEQWCTLYNHNYDYLPAPGYHVDTDKGFNYSTADEAFVCQKKNHFQVTVHVRMVGEAKYVKTPKGPAPIDSFHISVFGMRMEAHNNVITIEQSQSDRSKKPFLPVNVNLPGDKITKVTLGRLHFSETTANNMRKKGKPNPDQRYFLMVVGLYASVRGKSHLVVAHVSERIIVRASNPGQFENDSEVHWQRGQVPDSVVCQGRVGINTETPDEALVVCGNAKIMGSVMHPSDKRAKQNIQEVDSTEQLRRIAQMRIVEFDYKPEFAEKMGIEHVHETGVIAQEVKVVLPNAVKQVGDVTCTDGEKIPNFLMVDKEQIFMENVGAVKQLCKLTDNLETRIQELEVLNTRLSKTTPPSTISAASRPVIVKTTTSTPIPTKGKVNKLHTVPPPPRKPSPFASVTTYIGEKYRDCCRHRAFQAGILTVVAILAFLVISITTMYLLTLDDENCDLGGGPLEPLEPVPSSGPTAGPPEVDVCSFLLDCDQVYCCPPDPGKQEQDRDRSTSPAKFITTAPPRNSTTPPTTVASETPMTTQNQTTQEPDPTLQFIMVMPSEQEIDQRYCLQGWCRPGSHIYSIPISKLVPDNMRISLLMKSAQPLVVHKCYDDETDTCDTVMTMKEEERFTTSEGNTTGTLHEWILPVARLQESAYSFRATLPGKADCSTSYSYAGTLFTDYHFHFYRRCE